jgi:predicted DNA-binding transcriptional regulator YafY
VTLRVAPEAARQAAERWPSLARPQPDGSLEVSFDATLNEHLLGLVLGFGGRAVIVSPPEARAALLARVAALRIRHAHEPDPPAGPGEGLRRLPS